MQQRWAREAEIDVGSHAGKVEEGAGELAQLKADGAGRKGRHLGGGQATCGQQGCRAMRFCTDVRFHQRNADREVAGRYLAAGGAVQQLGVVH